MNCSVQVEKHACKEGLDGTAFTLCCGSSKALVWPGLGCNCLSWLVPWKNETTEVFYHEPTCFTDPQPMRYGNPILFPFPNRIRDGRYRWEGKSYELPIGDPQKKNAIHGFAFASPWGVVDRGVKENEAWLRCRFRLSEHAPECRALWPADAEMELTYRLQPLALLSELVVRNPDRVPLPFGVGFHPYFRVSADRARMQVLAGRGDPVRIEQWRLEGFLPTGERQPLDGFRQRLASGAAPTPGEFWDDAFRITAAGEFVVSLHDPQQGPALRIAARGGFRELVIFTPPHRQAVCLEPYTCITDAVNLQAKGVDTGLVVLRPGESWSGSIALTVTHAGPEST